MAVVAIQGLTWCQHAGWMLVLYDAASRRRLQVTLSATDAVAVGQELGGHASERSGLYRLVGALLRSQPELATVTLGLAETSRARTALVLRTDDGPRQYPTSTADGVALALSAGLPIEVEPELLEAFGVACSDTSGLDDATPGTAEIPAAFRSALDVPTSDGE